MEKPWNQMTPEEQRALNIERFGYDPTNPSTFLGEIEVEGNWYDFYLFEDGGIDICNFGCNGTLMKGTMGLLSQKVELPPAFAKAFLKLLANHKQGKKPPRRPK